MTKYTLIDNQNIKDNKIFNSKLEVEEYLKNLHSLDLENGTVYDLYDLLDIGDYTLLINQANQ